MRRHTRLALGALALAVVGLHLGLLGGLQIGSPSVDPVSPPAVVVEDPQSPVPAAPDAAAPAPAGPAVAVDRASAAGAAPSSVGPSPAPAPPTVPKPAAAPIPAWPGATQASASPSPEAVPSPPPAEPSEPASDATRAEPEGAASAPMPASVLPPLPVYRTRVPPATRIVYRLSRGAIVGTGELDWRPQVGAYRLRLEGKLPLIGTLITQTSRGRVDAGGLVPERHTDQRLRRSEQAANFQREQGLVSFSGGARPLSLAPGLQDRLSVMVQLAAIAAAGPQPPPAGQALSIGVVGVRGDAAVWILRFEGIQAIDTPEGPVKAWRYLREPESPHDTVAEFWLDPTRQFLPVRVRLTDGSGEPLELRRQSPEP